MVRDSVVLNLLIRRANIDRIKSRVKYEFENSADENKPFWASIIRMIESEERNIDKTIGNLLPSRHYRWSR